MAFEIEAYSARTGHDRALTGVDGLRSLQAAQMRAITFENIDVFLGGVPDIAPGRVFDKLVHEGRGGYCFELNTLFGMALKAHGFEARPVLARVRNGAARAGARTHFAWIVNIDGREWLADTGFGGSGTVLPMDLLSRDAQSTALGEYRLRDDPDTGELILERKRQAGWNVLFGLDGSPVTDADIEAANFVAARWEKAPFSSNLMISRHVHDGKLTLLNRIVRSESGSTGNGRRIGNADELGRVLARDFEIDYDGDTVARVWAKLKSGDS